MAEAEQGLTSWGTSSDPATYGSADAGETEKPPPFDSVSEEPPSYSSVMQELRDAKKTSSGTVDLSTKVLTILVNTIVFTVLMGVALLIPIVMVVMGAAHIHDCPVQKLIPIFLIVSGSLYIIKTILDLAVRYKKNKSGSGSGESSYTKPNSVSRLLACVLLVFFILGNVWVYANFRPSDDPTSPRYCYPPLYYFAFWLITLTYIFLVLSCCCAFCTIGFITIGILT